MFHRLWLFVLLSFSLASPFWAQNEADIYRVVSPSVVSVKVELAWLDTAGGAGFVIDQDGHILTNAHVVEDARALTVVFHDGYEAPADLIGMDTRVDLAIIKVDAARHRLKPVTFGDSDALVVGESVVAIGSPHGLDATLTRGIISGLNRRLEFDDGATMEGAIQTDAMLASGNSGGPLLNQAGEVIGVNTASYRGTALGFAIPSNIARQVAESMIASLQPTLDTERWTPIPLSLPTTTPVATPTNRSNANRTPVDTIIATVTPKAFATSTPVPTEQALHATFAAILAATDTAQAFETAWTATSNAVLTQWGATRTAEAAVQSTFEGWMTGTALAAWPILTPYSAPVAFEGYKWLWLTDVECMVGYFTRPEIGRALQILRLRKSYDQLRFSVTRLSNNDTIRPYETKLDSNVGAGLEGMYYYFGRQREGWYAVTITRRGKSATMHFEMAGTKAHFVVFYCEFAPTATPNRATSAARSTANRATADARGTPTPTPYYVSVDSIVNLRSGPGTNHFRVGVAQPGDTFAVIGYQAGSPYNWLKVRYDSGAAWIAESLTQSRKN